MKRNKYICGSFLFFLSLLILNSSCVSNLDGIYESYQKSGMINRYNSTDIRQRHLDSLNALRQENGLGKIAISNNLNSSAATHARDIYFQQRSWNFGSDGSSPQKRADVAGFEFPRSVLLDPTASHVGLGWYQEASGKLWWVQVLGKSSGIF